MDVMIAAFGLVNDYPGGAGALAPVVGKSPTTLSHEVSPTYPTAKFGLADAVKLSVWANDRRVLNAFAGEMSCMVVPLAADVPGVEGIGTRVAELAREFADVMGVVAADLSDGQVSGTELARIEREAGQLVGAIQALLTSIKGLHDAGALARADQPAHLRAVGA